MKNYGKLAAGSYILELPEAVFMVLCLSGQEIVPTGQRPLLKDSWRQNSIFREEQLADLPIAYLTSVNVM